jgi:hypothetical protein
MELTEVFNSSWLIVSQILVITIRDIIKIRLSCILIYFSSVLVAETRITPIKIKAIPPHLKNGTFS